METTSGKETIIVLRRLIAYSEKIFQLSKDIVTLVSDRRERPRISTAAVVKSSLVLFWARMGSINAWEQVGRARFWQCWLEEPTFSADTLGRVHRTLTKKPRGVGGSHLATHRSPLSLLKSHSSHTPTT